MIGALAAVAVYTFCVSVMTASGVRLWAVRVADRRFRRCQEEPPADGRLLGTWQSDGDATVAEWRTRRPMTDEQTAELRTVFGRLRVSWGLHTAMTDYDGKSEEYPYRLIAVDSTSAVIRAWDRLNNRDEFMVIHFDGRDRYLLYAAGGPLREYFRRVGVTADIPQRLGERPV